MPLRIVLLTLLFLSLFISTSSFLTAQVGASPASGSPDPAFNFLLQPNYYECIHLSVLGGQNVTLTVTSNLSVNVYLMTPSQLQSFQSGTVQYIYYNQGTSTRANIGPLQGGEYYIVVENGNSQTAEVNVQYGTVPVDIYHYSTLPAPIGIADYGVLNNSGSLSPYLVKYREALGHFTVYSIGAYNSSPPQGIGPYSASLQLNVVLQVNTIQGPYEYWLQNVIEFFTNNETYAYVDNVWNFTSTPSFLTNSTVTGGGAVFYSGNELYYAYGTSIYDYRLPFSSTLVVNESPLPNGVLISFGYFNGSFNWYDNVTIHQPGVTSAYMLIDGYNETGSHNYYDAELVFGGGGNGEITNFTSMRSTLQLEYLLVNGTFAEPRELYGFGGDTAEAADDLQTTLTNGIPTVTLGRENFNSTLFQTVSPLSISLLPAFPTVDQGQESLANIELNISGGILPYIVYVYVDGTLVSNFTLFSQRFDGLLELGNLSAGEHSFYLLVKDGSGVTVSSRTFELQVNPDPQVSISTNLTYLDSGQTIPLYVTPKLGTPPYRLTLYVNGTPYQNLNAGLNQVSLPGGVHSLQVILNDSSGFVVQSNVVVVHVNPDPIVYIYSPMRETDSGIPITLTAEPQRGTPPYTFVWYVNGTKVATGEQFNLTSPQGAYLITLILTDHVNVSSQYSVTILVNPDPQLHLTSNSSSNNPLLQGNNVHLLAEVRGGTPPYTFTWLVNGKEVANTSSPSYNLSLGPGSYNVQVKVRDSLGYTVSQNLTVQVSYNLTPFIVVVVVVLVVVAVVLLRRR